MTRLVFVVAALALLTTFASASCPGASCAGQGCGNGRCEWNESPETCPVDCGLVPNCPAVCGNKVCEPGENACKCPSDCGVCCVNGVCDLNGGETFLNCPADCAVTIRGTVIDAATGVHLGNPNGNGVTQVECCNSAGCHFQNPDGLGVFQFDVREPGDWKCTATLNTYLPNSQAISLEAGSAPQRREFVIPLRRVPGSISGRATTNNGLPVFGADVNCVPADNSSPTRHRKTSPTGNFFFANVDAAPTTGTNWTCLGTAPGFLPGFNFGVVMQGENTVIDLEMLRIPSTLSGRVIDAVTLEPVEDEFNVDCQPTGGFASPLLGNPVKTGNPEDGDFVFRNVLWGSYNCRAFLFGWFENNTDIAVPEGGVGFGIIYVTRRPGHLNGTVCEVDTQKLIGAALVQCIQQDADEGEAPVTRNGLTGSEGFLEQLIGRFKITNIPAGNYTCSATEPNQYFPSEPVTAIIVPGRFTEIKLEMEPLPGIITGRTREPTEFGGALVPEAQINCINERTEENFETFSLASITNPDEFNYLIENVTSGNVTCSCQAFGYELTNLTQRLLVPGGELIIDCPLRPITGTIVAEVADAQTLINVPSAQVTCYGISGGVSEVSLVVPPDAQGPGPEFVFSGPTILRIGTYQCEAVAEPEYLPSDPTFPIEIRGPGTERVTILVHPRPARVFGVVTDIDTGVFIEDAGVLCNFTTTDGDGHVNRTTSTDVDGFYLFDNVTEINTVVCTASHPFYEAETRISRTFRGQDTEINFQVKIVLGSITVRVKDCQSGDDIAGAVQCVGTNLFGTTDDYFRRIPESGFAPAPQSYVFQSAFSLRVGDYFCNASADSYFASAVNSFPIQISPSNQEVLLDICLDPRPAALIGTVFEGLTGPPLESLAGAAVRCQGTNTDGTIADPLQTFTDQLGNYRFDNLTLFGNGGSITCCASEPGYESACEEGILQRDTDTRVDITIFPFISTLTVNVRDSQNPTVELPSQVRCRGEEIVGDGDYDQTLPVSGRAMGAKAFTDLRNGRYICSAFNAPGYVDSPEQDPVIMADLLPGSLTIYLDPLPAAIEGTVFDIGDGRPGRAFGDVLVTCVFLRTEDGSEVALTQRSSTEAGAEGTFRFAPIRFFGGPARCSAAEDGFVLEAEQTVPVERDQTSETTLELRPNVGDLTISVVDCTSTSTVLAASVTCTGSNLIGGVSFDGTVPADGTEEVLPSGHEFLNLRNGRYSCVATSSAQHFPSDDGANVYTMEGDDVDLFRTICLNPRPARLLGTVFDAGSDLPTPEPLASANVDCTFVDASQDDMNTGVDGTYVFSPLTAFGTATCTASRSGYTSQTLSAEVVRATDTVLDFNLEPLPVVVQGTVLDDELGNVVPGAVVELRRQNSDGSDGVRQTRTTDADGFYTFGEQVRGRFTHLIANGPTGFLADQRPDNCSPRQCNEDANGGFVTVTQGVTQNVNYRLVPLPSTIIITVRSVEDDGSRPTLANAAVRCRRDCDGASIRPDTEPTDTDGLATFTDVAGGINYQCSATEPAYDEGTTTCFSVPRGQTVNQEILMNFRSFLLPAYLEDLSLPTPTPSIFEPVPDSFTVDVLVMQLPTPFAPAFEPIQLGSFEFANDDQTGRFDIAIQDRFVDNFNAQFPPANPFPQAPDVHACLRIGYRVSSRSYTSNPSIQLSGETTLDTTSCVSRAAVEAADPDDKLDPFTTHFRPRLRRAQPVIYGRVFIVVNGVNQRVNDVNVEYRVNRPGETPTESDLSSRAVGPPEERCVLPENAGEDGWYHVNGNADQPAIVSITGATVDNVIYFRQEFSVLAENQTLGDCAFQDFVLTPNEVGCLQGVVLDTDGRVVPNAQLSLDNPGEPLVAVTDASGAYLFDEVQATSALGRLYEMTIDAGDSYLSETVSSVVVNVGQGQCDTLDPTLTPRTGAMQVFFYTSVTGEATLRPGRPSQKSLLITEGPAEQVPGVPIGYPRTEVQLTDELVYNRAGLPFGAHKVRCFSQVAGVQSETPALTPALPASLPGQPPFQPELPDTRSDTIVVGDVTATADCIFVVSAGRRDGEDDNVEYHMQILKE